MNTHSTDNREWARKSDTIVGSKLEADGGFNCIKRGSILEVKADASGDLYVICGRHYSGKHYLSGQLNSSKEHSGTHYIGFWRAKTGAT